MKTFLDTPPRKLIVAFAVVMAALALASCATDGSSPATPVAPTVSSFDLGSSGPSASSTSVADSLQAWKDREKVRIAFEAARSVPVYDSLHALWQAMQTKGHARPNRATTVATCEPLPYAADVQIVGPEGAMFNVGPHRFYIPKGAITEPTVITVELPVADHAELDFSPHGLHFGTSYVLLDYHKCDVGSSKNRDVVYTDDSYNIVEKPASYDAKSYSSVWAAINHFSHYVVAY
ncbi:MAG: hypothetical protein HOQ09_13965 [Gemmatimonadaceae bacterium]|nr:hypothetical protein [Gemmatimonadaceae bacterium]